MNRLLLAGVLCIFLSPLSAAEHATKFVITDLIVQYGAQTFSGITEQANVSLAGTNVNGTTYVNGNLTANGAQLHDVVVNGSATIVNSTINGSISVYGELQLQNCTVYGELSTYFNILTLTNTSANTIINLNAFGQQNILLQNGSIVNGSITFLSGNGIVSLSTNSFLAGAVNGGKFVRS